MALQLAEEAQRSPDSPAARALARSSLEFHAPIARSLGYDYPTNSKNIALLPVPHCHTLPATLEHFGLGLLYPSEYKLVVDWFDREYGLLDQILMHGTHDGTQKTCGDGDGFEWIHDKALHESIVGRAYEHHEYIAKAIYASGDHPAPMVDVTNKVRTLFDDAGAQSMEVFKLSDFNSHFGNPNSDASKMLEITLQDGRVFFYDEDEECAVPHGRPKKDNTSHLRWQTFDEETVMSEAELLETLRDAGITYDSKYRVCDKNPVGAIQDFCKKHGKEISEFGCYAYRTFSNGTFDAWILFDDFIPCVDPERKICWSFHSQDNKEMWPMLLEKVMSTRSNDYNIWPKANLFPYSSQKWMYRIWDYGPEMFHIMEPIDSASGSGFQFLEEHVGKDAVCAFAWGRDGRLASPEQLMEVGLVASHGYSLVQCKRVGDRRFLQCRNPWGTFSWKGKFGFGYDWSEEPALATELAPNTSKTDNGVFWISREDMFRWSNPNMRFTLILDASEEHGYKTDSLSGAMASGDDAQPALVIKMPDQASIDAAGTSLFLFQAEGFDARQTSQSKRCYVDVYQLTEDGQRVCSSKPLISTLELGPWWGRETPAHRLHVGSGAPNPSVPAGCSLLLVVRPQPGQPDKSRVILEQGEKFFLRMASKPYHSRSADFKPFSAFLPVKHAVVSSAKYHETDVTNKVVELYDNSREDVKLSGGTCGQDGDNFACTDFNALFGDPAPGNPKQLTVSFQQDGEEKTVSVEESGWMRIPRAGQHSSEGCPDYDDFGETWGIKRASFGPLDVTQALRGILSDFGGKLEILKKFEETSEANLGTGDVFGDPAPGVPKKLILEFSSGTTKIWEDGDEVRIDVSDWKPEVKPSPARAGAGRGVALAKASREG
ncbi:CAPN7 [Symbiodinium sp. CCMP2592]|nr:CAPN7 [Symbiodinium sp. CCMP2592]